MKLLKAIGLSFIIIIASVMILRTYGYSIDRKRRIHSLLEKTEQLKFSKNPLTWQNAEINPYLRVAEIKGQLMVLNSEPKPISSINVKNETAFLIDLTQDTENINFLLNQWVNKNNLEEKILITSKYKKLLENIRNVKPRWLTSSSTTELYLSIFLKKLFIESIAPIKGDFILLSEGLLERRWWQELPTQEIERRGKKFLIEKNESYSFSESLH